MVRDHREPPGTTGACPRESANGEHSLLRLPTQTSHRIVDTGPTIHDPMVAQLSIITILEGIMTPRKLVRLFAVIMILAVSWGIAHVMFGWQPFLPPLVANWPTEAEFANRISNRFPSGIAQTEVVKELTRQGFTHSAAAKTVMSRLTSRFPCDRLWSVEWTADGEGRVIAITGKMYLFCM